MMRRSKQGYFAGDRFELACLMRALIRIKGQALEWWAVLQVHEDTAWTACVKIIEALASHSI